MTQRRIAHHNKHLGPPPAGLPTPNDAWKSRTPSYEEQLACTTDSELLDLIDTLYDDAVESADPESERRWKEGATERLWTKHGLACTEARNRGILS